MTTGGIVRSVGDMTQPTPHPPAPAPRGRPLGLPVSALVGLALLAVPRVVLHDLGLIHEGTGINALLVAAPPIAWVVTVLAAGVRRPFVPVLVIGAISGVFLAVVHQLLWGAAFGTNPPRLGGNLAGLDPGVQDVVIRLFSIPSSLLTGAIVGAVAGLVAWGLSALGPRGVRP